MLDKTRTVLSTCAECLALVSFVLAIVALASPYWATFDLQNGGSDPGYFGPWKLCKGKLHYASTALDCAVNATHYRPTIWPTIAGVIAAMGALCVGCAAVMGAFVILMNRSKERVCMPYKPAVVARLVLSALAALLAAVGAGIFNLQGNPNRKSDYAVRWSWAYYIQLLVVALEILLAGCSTLDFWKSRKLGGDPTLYNRDPSGQNAVTIDNPGFRDEHDRPTSSSAPNHSAKKIIHSSNSKNSPGTKKSPNGTHSSPGSRSSSRSPHRHSHQGTNTSKDIAYTPSSGDPYIYFNTDPNPKPPNGNAGRPPSASDSVDGSVIISIPNGSIGSVGTASNSLVSNGSLAPKSPLKSSMKKERKYQIPKPQSSFDLNNSLHSNDTTSTVTSDGVPNPGFSATSPTSSRNGTLRRVRIHTKSTDV